MTDSAADELGEITRHLLRFSPDALLVVDSGGVIRFANDTVTELFGYAPQGLVGQLLEVLVPERLRSAHARHMSAYLQQPRSREMGAALAALCARRCDGSEFAAGIRLAPFNINGSLFVAAAIRDVSERQRVNAALVVAREDAVRANRAKSRFLATASHDLRQPLHAVRLLNAAMSRLAPDTEIAGLLQHQQLAIDSMARLLDALLDISRLESGAIQPERTAVFLPEVLEELRLEFDSVARASNLELTVQPLAISLQTDRVLFHQLLQNLLANALKYTDHGSVSVYCERDAASGLNILVRDTGIGIPPDKLERIFDEYYQVDTHGAKRMGVGLGLAIVKEVAQLLDFKVTIASALGCYTEVKISVPAQALTAATAQQGSARAIQADAPPAARIVLIEDNDGVRMATALFLKLEGYATRSAGAWAEAEHLLQGLGADDLLIADYHLDSLHTGVDALRMARAISGMEVPGIILSGDMPAVLRTLREPIARVRFLSKPVDTAALLAAIKELGNAPVC